MTSYVIIRRVSGIANWSSDRFVGDVQCFFVLNIGILPASKDVFDMYLVLHIVMV